MPSRICIDCSPLLVRSAGVKTYLYHLVRSLKRLYPEAIGTYLEPETAGLHHGGGVEKFPVKLLALQALRMMPAQVRKVLGPRCDVFHVSNLLGWQLSGKRSAVSATIHDLTAWTVPECHDASQIQADKRFAAEVLCRADGLIAVSEHSRQDAIRVLGLKPEKIRVIYPGVAGEYFSARAETADKPYFVFVGTIEPRKNLDRLLSAWMSLPAAFRQEHELRIVGMAGWKAERTLRRMGQLVREPHGPRYLGYVPEEQMPGLTAGAQALVYPSLYEGFGLPVAQAMAAGCPVITSNVASLPEITGGAALLLDPMSDGEIAAAIRQVAESHALAERLRRAGKERARLFQWDDSARATFEYLSGLRRL